MKYRPLITIAAACCALVCIAGCGSTSTPDANSGSAPSTSQSASADASANDASPATDADAATDGAATGQDGEYKDIGGSEIYVPANFESAQMGLSVLYTWEKQTDDDTIYLCFDEESHYIDDHEESSYALDDVPNILADRVKSNVGEIVDMLPSKYTISVDTSDTTTIDGNDYLVHNGVIHTEDADGVTHDFKYSALYTLYTNNYDTKVPAVALAFSDCKSPDTQAQVEQDARQMFEQARWKIDY
ncbi:hypothetical protein [Bifidobacterium pseudolongum]|uniref:Lipoprotein n=1 Tax=Bifidobacterium pseudolongum subsp. globosum TaxID=1690 RepID=A0A2N3R4I3_9BIFI|nr:hypothetical protein [Bifidobacterium pseudolongum]PKV03529.1 hypothetical protein CQR50_1237 [Bifidobacterium pseudolongum subsp. globosum]